MRRDPYRGLRRLGLLGACWLASAMASATASAMEIAGPVVRTSLGPVVGLSENGVEWFRGLPFAAPPIGPLRFAEPQPVHPWADVRDGTRFRDACPQVVRYGVTEGSDQEDCLYLNVVRPSKPASNGRLRPVLVWIYGGAFVGGGANLYPTDHLAREDDLVVVSINYRIGALGFLRHPALATPAAGALGIADQRAALRWVKQHIASFGGDPSNVTIAGESAGAASVCLQLAAPPDAQGPLFARAIAQSAGCVVPLRDRAAAERIALDFARRVGCADVKEPAACLRAVPVATLLAAQTDVTAEEMLAFAPSTGSALVPVDPGVALRRGHFARVPVLYGGNRDEMRLYVGYEVAAGLKVDADHYPAELAHRYGERAPAVLAHYPLSDFPSAASALGTAESDYLPPGTLSHCVFLRTEELLSRHVPVYAYEFTDRGAPPVMDDPGFELGAVHAAELPYFFPGLTYRSRWDGPHVTSRSEPLARAMLGYWGSFARTGVPKAPGLPVWPRYQKPADVLRLDASGIGVFDADAAHQCGFWRSLYPQLRDGG